MTDRRPTAQEAGDAVCAEWGRALVAAGGRGSSRMKYRSGWFYRSDFGFSVKGPARRKSTVLAMTDRLWARARENATMKDSK
jgi:hypothetical protein